MSKKKNYKVGDKIIDYGQVFRIFKILRQRNSNGGHERVMYFRPFYRSSNNYNVVSSIPMKNIEQTEIRDPLSANEIKTLFIKLKKRKRTEVYFDINKTKDLFKRYDPDSDVRLLRDLWKEKKDKSETFSKNKRDIFDLVHDRFSQECAIVKGLPLQKAKDDVILALQW